VASLNVHQSESSDHDRLGFHPDCPACRQDRLFGVFAPRPLCSYRLRALLAAGVLALSAGAGATSVASEPDSHQEGVSIPEQGEPPEPGDSTSGSPDQPTDEHAGGGGGPTGDELGQGPGGETALPFEAAPVPSDPPSSDVPDGTAPLEEQFTAGPEDGFAFADPDAPEAIDVDEVPVPPIETDAPLDPSAPVAPPLGEPESPTAAPTGPGGRRYGTGRMGPERDHRASHRDARERRDHTAPAPPATAAPPADAPALSAPAQGEPAPALRSAAPVPPPAGARFHVVRPGESLWSIAADLLGPEAPSAAIAVEVRRLWEWNKGRIGTGDPDLLPIAVKLRVR
jgi:hypothetical protein